MGNVNKLVWINLIAHIGVAFLYDDILKERREKPMSSNAMWIGAHWPYLAQESLWCRVGLTTYLAVGGLLFVQIYKKEEVIYIYFVVHLLCVGVG